MAVTYSSPSLYGTVNNPVNGQPSGSSFTTAPGLVVDLGLVQLRHASIYSADPVYRKAIYHDSKMYDEQGFLEWFEEHMDTKTMCTTKYSLAHFFPAKKFFNIANGSPIVVAAIASPGAAPTTQTITWPAAETVGPGLYLVPRTKGVMIVPSTTNAAGVAMLDITNVVAAAGNTFTVTVSNRHYLTAVTIPALADVKILSTQELKDCECSTGSVPSETGLFKEDLKILKFTTYSDELCGDLLKSCENLKFPWVVTDTKGCITTYNMYYGAETQKVMNEHKRSKKWNMLIHPEFGILPKVSKYAIKWDLALPTVFELGDFDLLTQFLIDNKNKCKDFAFFAESRLLGAFEKFVREQGVINLNYTNWDPSVCKTLNLDYCSFKYRGITYTFYLEPLFNDKDGLGGAGTQYLNTAIGIPMMDRALNCKKNDSKKLTMVYFQDEKTGEIMDNIWTSDGILNGRNGERGKNTYPLDCEKQRYSLMSQYVLEMHEPETFINVNGI